MKRSFSLLAFMRSMETNRMIWLCDYKEQVSSSA